MISSPKAINHLEIKYPNQADISLNNLLTTGKDRIGYILEILFLKKLFSSTFLNAKLMLELNLIKYGNILSVFKIKSIHIM